jgi:hypothetical protein
LLKEDCSIRELIPIRVRVIFSHLFFATIIIFSWLKGVFMNNFWVVSSSILVMAMYYASELLGNREIIFPVLAALALGVWVIGNPLWTRNLLLIWLSPTIASITGVFLKDLYPTVPIFSIFVLLFLAAIQLTLFRSEVAPSLAIMILPVFLEIESLYYVFSVSFFSAVIAVIQLIRMRIRGQKVNSKETPVKIPINSYFKEKIIHWIYVYSGVSVIVCISFFTTWLYILVPPLIVTFYEFMRNQSFLRSRFTALIILISVSALSGVILLKLLHDYLHFPVWFVAGLIVIWVSILFMLLKISFAPAAAISLLPTVVPVSELWIYPLQVTLGVVLFLCIGKLFVFIGDKFNKKQRYQTNVNESI